ncbi:MAG: hypothetical protein RLZZ507_1485 [Cyanobacteriota bacterium]|jgi:WD40 repeat protein
MSTNNYYQIGGSLTYANRTYVVREADKQLFELLNAGEYCFILNSRQMGKSSLRVKTGKKLRSQGVKCTFIDMTLIGTHVTKEQWYKGIAYQILDGLELDTELDFTTWWKQHEYLTEIQRLKHLMESVIFVKLSQNIVIFLDEIDSIIKIPFKDDFFAFIRGCYNLRAENSAYKRLSFCLLGVSTPADLIPDKRRTPFNIGRLIELTGFTFAEAKDALIPGLQGKVANPEEILKQVLYWTGGQPFLTQKLCSLIVQHPESQTLNIEQLVKDSIIENWESQDEPEHLITIRDRLLFDENKAIRLLGLYQQILLSSNQSYQHDIGVIYADHSQEQTELKLSGLVVNKNNHLQVYNPIYQAVFNQNWIQDQLNSLRPYSQAINKWLKSQRQPFLLLEGTALTDAQKWAINKRLSDEDYQFLAASQAEQDRKINQVLVDANKQAKRMILRGGITLGITSMLSIILALITTIYTQLQLKISTETIRIEKAGVNALQQFESNQLDGLISAIQATEDLKKLVNNDHKSLANYPATTPISALFNILNQIREKNQLIGHQEPVRSVAFSPDNQIIASASDDGTIKLWQRDGTFIKNLTEDKNKVNSISFSPNGKMIAAGYDNGTIKIWQRDGKLIKTFNYTNNSLDKNTVYSISFSPNGKMIASGSNDNTIKLWGLDGKLIKTFTGHQRSVYAVSFSPDGEKIVSGSADHTIKIWNLDGTIITTIKNDKNPIYAVSFSPDGKTIASGNKDKTVKLWQLDGKLIKTFTGHKETVNTVNFSPDGKIIASGSGDKTVKLWKLDGTLIKTLSGHQDSIWNVNFSQNGKMLASGSLDKTIKLWQLQDLPITHIPAHKDWITSINFSPDGKIIASGSADGKVKFWTKNGRLITAIDPQIIINYLKFSPDGKTLFILDSNNGIIKQFQLDGTGMKTLMKNIVDLQSEITSISLSSDAKTLVSGSSNGTIKLWQNDGKIIKTLPGHNSEVTSVSFSPDGQTIASGSIDGKVKIWQKDSTSIMLSGHNNNKVTSVSFNANGTILASSSIDGTINLWKTDGTLILTLNTKYAITSISFSPDSQTLVTGSEKGSLSLWNLNVDNLLTQSYTWLKDYLKNHPQS